MRQFIIPQFLDVESKIIWFITARQFIIMMAASGLSFAAYKLADTALFIVLLIIIMGSASVLSFAKVNDQQFHIFLINIIVKLKKPSLRIWDRQPAEAEVRAMVGLLKKKKEKTVEPPPQKPRLEGYRLSELSLLVDTGGVYRAPEK